MFIGKNYFCVSQSCIQMALNQDTDDPVAFYPPFPGKVAVPQNLLKTTPLPQVEGIEWVEF